MTATETWLLIVFLAFAVEECTQWIDAGTMFYASDIWSWLDMVVILIGLAFLICRELYNSLRGYRTFLTLCPGIIGLLKDDDDIVDTSFDILSLEALFLVPRYLHLRLWME